MKRRQAKRLIIEAWDSWLKAQAFDVTGPNGRESLKFFVELEDARSPLLEFDPRGRDKWLIIHSWLQSASRVGELPLSSRRVRHRLRRMEARAPQLAESPQNTAQSILKTP